MPKDYSVMSAQQGRPLWSEVEPPDDKGSSTGNKKQKFSTPSDEVITRFVGALIGGAVLGSSYASVPMIGALIGALVGAGVVAFHARHAF
jgi:predicted lipid-binding transport protein (Tim44 family)